MKTSTRTLSNFANRGRFHRGNSARSRRAAATAVLSLAAASAINVSATSAAVESWTPGGATGGSGTWDTVTPNWFTTAQTTWTNANSATFSGTGGTVGVDAGGITLGIGTTNVTGYTFTGGPITLSGVGTAGFYVAGSSATGVGTTTVNSVLAGTSGLRIYGGSYSYANAVIGGLNTYTGPTQLYTDSIFFTTLANAGTASSFGMGSAAGATTAPFL